MRIGVRDQFSGMAIFLGPSIFSFFSCVCLAGMKVYMKKNMKKKSEFRIQEWDTRNNPIGSILAPGFWILFHASLCPKGHEGL